MLELEKLLGIPLNSSADKGQVDPGSHRGNVVEREIAVARTGKNRDPDLAITTASSSVAIRPRHACNRTSTIGDRTAVLRVGLVAKKRRSCDGATVAGAPRDGSVDLRFSPYRLGG